jgi:light-regulated signal transduction histidine kinase (bacteriophytochrome)
MVGGFGRCLVEEESSRLTQEGQGNLCRILAAEGRMVQLLNGLARLGQVSEKPLARTTVDLSGLAREVVADLKREDRAGRVACRIADGLRVYADPDLLRMALRELFHNAAKFTGSSPEPEVALSRVRGDGMGADMHVFGMRDNGTGYDSQYAARLFCPFQSLHAQPEVRGVGLGLALVRRVVHRLGGRVWAQSKLGQGATFFLALPADAEPGPNARSCPSCEPCPSEVRNGREGV